MSSRVWFGVLSTHSLSTCAIMKLIFSFVLVTLQRYIDRLCFIDLNLRWKNRTLCWYHILLFPCWGRHIHMNCFHSLTRCVAPKQMFLHNQGHFIVWNLWKLVSLCIFVLLPYKPVQFFRPRYNLYITTRNFSDLTIFTNVKWYYQMSVFFGIRIRWCQNEWWNK